MQKKRGPAKRSAAMVSTHIFLPEPMLEWAKIQPEGLAGTVRRLLAQEMVRLTLV